MNAVGRQVARSNSAMQRGQYSDAAAQDFEAYGSRLSRRSNRLSEEEEVPRSSSMRRLGDYDTVEFSPGLLDLHSFDTELLPQMHVRGKSFDDVEQFVLSNRLAGRTRGFPENNLSKSVSVDKERANNVAKIKVVVRKRPLNKKEIAKKEEDVISIEPHSNALTVHEMKLKVDLTAYEEKHEFVFDAVLDEDVSNDEVYFESVEPIVPLIFQRTKATCFAYGQTGSGKTYTMQPLPLKASQHILRLMLNSYRNQGFQLLVSFFEIYGGKLYDLLNDRKKLFMREDGKQQVCIVGLQEYMVTDVETIKELIEKGSSTRSTGTTGANEESSRSHAILQLCIKKSADGNESKPARLVGKLSFIDLAGSERGADTTDTDKQTRMEGAEINKSLLALKECIRALDNDQGHIPFRGSKLTEVLRDSFVGDSRTVMISCISPSSGSCEHTLNTLRYADRVKSLSKGSSSRKQQTGPSSSSLRESTTVPLSSYVDTEDNTPSVPQEKSTFGWSKQIDRELSPQYNVNRVHSGRAEGRLPASLYSDYYNQQIGGQTTITDDDFDYPDQTYEKEKISGISNQKVQNCQTSVVEEKKRTGSQVTWKDQPDSESTNSHPDDDLIAVLQEEDDLLTAHRRQVEKTIDIVRKEMNLLVEADQPGNRLDDYIFKLDAILSQKAEGILQLQTQLARFQKHLHEHNVFVSSTSK